MIRVAEAGDAAAVLGAASASPGLGPKLWVDWTLSRQNPALPYRFYIAGGAVLEHTGNSLTVLGRPSDEEELLSFVDFMGIQKALCNAWAPPGWQPDPLLLMLREAAPGEEAMPEEALDGLDEAPAPGEVLELLDSREPLPPARREALYADLCVRLSRGLAALWGIRGANGALLSTAGAYCITPGEIYISGVETRPGAEGRGLASALIRRLCRRYAPRRAGLLCWPALAPYYEKLGFAQGPSPKAATRPAPAEEIP